MRPHHIQRRKQHYDPLSTHVRVCVHVCVLRGARKAFDTTRSRVESENHQSALDVQKTRRRYQESRHIAEDAKFKYEQSLVGGKAKQQETYVWGERGEGKGRGGEVEGKWRGRGGGRLKREEGEEGSVRCPEVGETCKRSCEMQCGDMGTEGDVVVNGGAVLMRTTKSCNALLPHCTPHTDTPPSHPLSSARKNYYKRAEQLFTAQNEYILAIANANEHEEAVKKSLLPLCLDTFHERSEQMLGEWLVCTCESVGVRL